MSPNILERGKEYAKEGKVVALTREGDKVHASVKGKKEYSVSFSLDEKDRLISYHCDCPYPHLCKHVVAVLFALEERSKQEEDPVYRKKESYRAIQEHILLLARKRITEEYLNYSFSLSAILPTFSREESLTLIKLYLERMFGDVLLCPNPVQFSLCFSRLHSKFLFQEEDIEDLIESFLTIFAEKKQETARMVACLLYSPETSPCLQNYLLSKQGRMSPSLSFALSCLEKRYAPKNMLPDFVLLLAKMKVNLVGNSDLIKAKNHFRKEGMSDSLVSLLHLLLAKGEYASIEEQDIAYLMKVGLSSDARDIAGNLVKMTDDFRDYLRFRSLFSDSEYSLTATRIEPFLTGKSYFNSVLLVDGRDYFPEDMVRFSYQNINPEHLFLAKNRLKDPEVIHRLTELAHVFLEKEISKKRRNKRYFFYLLYLESVKDDSLSYYLFHPSVLEDQKEPQFHAYWLFMVDHNNLLSQAGLTRYLGGQHVSN